MNKTRMIIAILLCALLTMLVSTGGGLAKDTYSYTKWKQGNKAHTVEFRTITITRDAKY